MDITYATISRTTLPWCTMYTVKYHGGFIHYKHNSCTGEDVYQAQYKDTVVTAKSELSAKCWITKQRNKECNK